MASKMGRSMTETTFTISLSGKNNNSVTAQFRQPSKSCSKDQQHQQQLPMQQQQPDEAVSFRCRSKKEVSWGSGTVDNESLAKKTFHKEYYLSLVVEVNAETYMGMTPGSMQMKLVKRS